MDDKISRTNALGSELIPKKRLQTARENPSSPPGVILKAAEDIFAEYGYNGTTTREIAKKCGVNIANIHYYWGSKEELWHAVVYNVIMQIMDSTKSILEFPVGNVEGALRHTIGILVDILADNPNYARILQHSSVKGFSEEIAKDINISLLEIGRAFIKLSLKKEMIPDFNPDLLLFGLTGAFAIFFIEKDGVKAVFDEDSTSYSPAFRQKMKDTLYFIVSRVFGIK